MIRTLVRRRGTTVAIITALLVLAVGAPAQAAEAEEHCVVLLDDGTVVCASTLDEADTAFTEKTGLTRVEDAAARGGVGVLAIYSLATVYQNANYGGSSFTLTRSTPCNGVTQAGYANLAGVGLDNQVSSFVTYSTCQVRLYDGTNFTGSTFGYASTQSSLPTFNDVASSVRAR